MDIQQILTDSTVSKMSLFLELNGNILMCLIKHGSWRENTFVSVKALLHSVWEEISQHQSTSISLSIKSG